MASATELAPITADETTISPKGSLKSNTGVSEVEEKVRASIKSNGSGAGSEAEKPQETPEGEEKDPEAAAADPAAPETEAAPSGEEVPEAPVEEAEAVPEAPVEEAEAPPSGEEVPEAPAEEAEAVNPPEEVPEVPLEPKVEETPAEQIEDAAIKLEPIETEAGEEVKEEKDEALDLPSKLSQPGSRRVSFSEKVEPIEPDSPGVELIPPVKPSDPKIGSSTGPRQPSKGFRDKSDEPGGFKSNKDLKMPSIKEDPSLMPTSASSDRSTSMSRPGPQQQPPWMVAAFSLMVLTVIMRFFMSNLKFVATAAYAGVVSLLALRFYGIGPLATRRGGRGRR